jgi:DNA-binding LacI/PurR family transcriptional regulator
VKIVRFQSKVEQSAEYLRTEMQRGRWGSFMPGRNQLAKELGINSKTVEEALRLLERDHLLVSQGAGRRRRIVIPEGIKPPSLQVAVLHYEPETRGENYMVDLLHLLADAGHTVFSAKKTLLELGMNVRRIAKMVEETQADAWVIVGGSREVLEWFTKRPTPAFALFGRRRGLAIAGSGPDKPPAMVALTERLIGLGHERIVLMVRAERRQPQPGATERAFLETLQTHGVKAGPYHLPDWEETVDGFHRCLEELFRLTPPTALIVDEAPFFTAALQFCSKRGMRAPEHISLACCDPDPNFFWCKPSIAHIRWDISPVVQRVLRWAANVSRGKTDRRQTETKATFFEGGTIGPAGHL